MSVKFSNNAVTSLTDSPLAGATFFNVASASPFPTLASGDWTYVSLTSEVVKVTAISGTTFTCDATSAAHASGESVELRMTAELLNDFAEDTEALPLTGGTMTGTIAGFTSTGIDDNATSTKLTISDTTITGVGAFTSTSIDATKLSGALPAISGANLTDLPASGFTSSTFLDQGTLFSRDSANTLHIPDLGGTVDGTLVEVTATTKSLNTSGNWDGVGSYETASNRAGKDFYVYLLSAGGVILSNSSTYPSGYTAANSRKIAGFHCLAVAVGTISGHSLTGYAQGDILPRSVWDRFNRPISAPEGMVLSDDGMWVDIYLPSYSGTLLKSVNGGTIADGSNGWHGYKFEQWFGDIGKKLIRQTEFVTASIGANQGTNITGSSDPGTTGGHTDTAGRRMISNIGCEDMAGVLYQWSRDPGGVYSSGASWANAYDGNDSGVAGQHYQAPYRAYLGGNWGSGSRGGSRYSFWGNSPLGLRSSRSGRGCAEPAANRL